jgi:ubiquinone/menaquinone biosynthesis C-methylase UbiE
MSNADQIDYWNSKVGDTWARMQERLDLSFTPLTEALLALAAPQAGEQVLDVGCGTGEISLVIAAAVGEEGGVLGLDISEQMLARARQRAEELLSHAEFRSADAANFDDEGDFDLIVSRFGVMFFNDPEAAFANLHARATSGGRLVFACWQPAVDNPWATLPMTVLADLLPEVPTADPQAPGPFAFADPERVGAILAAAGWQDIVFHALPFAMVTGTGDDPIASAVHFSLRIGPAARAIRDAGPAAEIEARRRLSAAFAAHLGDGVVALPANAWLVAARA